MILPAIHLHTCPFVCLPFWQRPAAASNRLSGRCLLPWVLPTPFHPLPQGLSQPGRTVVGWFQAAAPQLFQPSTFPVFIMQDPATRVAFYGFPEFGGPGGVLRS
jgi:hypothetical protein